MKRIIMLFFAILVLSGCSLNNESSEKANSDVKEENDTKKIKEKEQEYIQSILKGDYDTVIKETEELDKDNYLSNYSYLASAFKKATEERETEIKYIYINNMLKKVKFVPDELEQKMNNLQKLLSKREEEEKDREEVTISERINAIVKLLDEHDYDAIISEYGSNEDEEVRTLVKYARALNDVESLDVSYVSMSLRSLAWIDPNYNGVKADEIKSFASKYLTKEKWAELHEQERSYDALMKARNERLEKEAEEEARKPLPTIGMTTDEVLNSKWGRPQDINRTTTANGTSEQWVYDGYKYLYFEDGILTTIQD
ncbi:lipoprotein [Peribacillus asahii]|uniref:lipoprotein n=1 Tax=Peribacillus asahii TaxID=228899 RepID=UPI00207A08FB|nr:lipoprotein [Peribacillus asahii]USK69190.1 lipoprotein [Peribacillus asahii]